MKSTAAPYRRPFNISMVALYLLVAVIMSKCCLMTVSAFAAISSPRSIISFSSALGSSNKDRDNGPIYDDIPSAFEPLFSSVSRATVPRSQDNTVNAHDPFRYEWGTWVDEEEIVFLMERIDEIRVESGVYDTLICDDDDGDPINPIRLRVAGGDNWDCILHFLPPNTQWMGSWPTGSWAMVKSLSGMTEVAQLRGPDRNGLYRQMSAKSLRGGGDGTLGGGASTAGVDAVKYVGGPVRSYTGKSGKTILFEIVIRPPNNKDKQEQMDSLLGNIDDTLSVVLKEPEIEEEPEQAEQIEEEIQNTEPATDLGAKLGMTFDKVGGLDNQLDAIARRVLASRANPAAAKRLGVSHVRGILLSGPPGCGKTLLARELAKILGAREPQIVNGPEILDKFIGEAEKKVRELFAPAEQEYNQVGDESALHIIILDEMDAIARKRGSMTADTTGVRDSVVNQLLAKMDGVKEASNVLVVGLTNRPELLDPALLRPGRLEVQLRVELPDLLGRRDILRIHTRRMKAAGGLSPAACDLIEDVGEHGIAARSDHFSGAEIAGLVRSSASFALARSIEGDENGETAGIIGVGDLDRALREVLPALGKQDEVLQQRFPLGISPCSSSMKRIMRDLERFTTPVFSRAPRLQSLLLVGAGGSGGAGATALAAWAAAEASSRGSANYVRLVTALDVLSGESSGGDEGRAAALMDRFSEAKEMQNSLLVLDDVDQLCAGSGPGGYSSIMLATLRALLRISPALSSSAKAGGQSESKSGSGKTIHIIAATSRSDAACVILHELFDETIVVPLLSEADDVRKLLSDGLSPGTVTNVDPMAKLIIKSLGSVGCKTALRLAERAIAMAGSSTDPGGNGVAEAQLAALVEILEDLAGDVATSERLCEVF